MDAEVLSASLARASSEGPPGARTEPDALLLSLQGPPGAAGAQGPPGADGGKASFAD